MGCGCNNDGFISDWNDWLRTEPKDPRDLISNAYLGATQGTFANSTNFGMKSGWNGSGNFPLAAAAPVCIALGTDNKQMEADAAQWTLSHLTKVTAVAPPLQRVLFLRGGLQWQMNIFLDFTGTTYDSLQLSFRDNAGTRGDDQGTWPVIEWSSGTFTGAYTLGVTLKQFGRVSMGLMGIVDGSGDEWMFESEWIIVP